MEQSVLQMMTHLRAIAQRIAENTEGVAAIRAIIDDYAKMDAEICRFEATTISCNDPPGKWVIAANSAPDRRILYLHGGSWMSGSIEGYRHHVARIATASGCSVFVLDYALAPEHPYPAGLDDCIKTYDWICHNAPQSASHGRINREKTAKIVAIVGDSAGANLTLATALRLKQEAHRRPPNALVCLSPATDLTWQSRSLQTRAALDPIIMPERLALVTQCYLQGIEKASHPYVSPLYGDLAGLPRLLIQVGDAEVLLDDSTRFAQRAEALGVAVNLQIFKAMPHVFQMFAPTVKQAQIAINKIGHFLND